MIDCVKKSDLHKFVQVESTCLILLFRSYLCALSRVAGGILRGSRRERLLSKFVENECEKIDRLMELYMR